MDLASHLVAGLTAISSRTHVRLDALTDRAEEPDPVATWERSAPVLPFIRLCGLPAALVAQDGFEEMEIDWTAFDCLFLGGSTEWKLSRAAADVAREARAQGLWTHMGRVNSMRRLRYAYLIGIDSVDGTYLAFGPRANGGRLLRWLHALADEDATPRLFELSDRR